MAYGRNPLRPSRIKAHSLDVLENSNKMSIDRGVVRVQRNPYSVIGGALDP